MSYPSWEIDGILYHMVYSDLTQLWKDSDASCDISVSELEKRI